MGIGPAIIQYKDLTETDLDSIFTATLILGLVLGEYSLFLHGP